MRTMHRSIAALAIALLAVAGCDSADRDVAPAEGSCQALVDEILAEEDLDLGCHGPLGRLDWTESMSVDGAAVCITEVVEDLETCDAERRACRDEAFATIEAGECDEGGECAELVEACDNIADDCGNLGRPEYQVAYAALCELHGNTAADYCDTSQTLGCEG